MAEVLHSYKSSTRSAFKNPVQEVLLELNQQAILDGYVREGDNFKFIISKVSLQK